MQQYNIFQAIYLSFFSRKLYRDVARQWGGKVFLYLLMLLALSWIAFVITAQIAINAGYTQVSDRVVAQIPILTIKEGQISTPENKPYFITNSKGDRNIAVIDTTGRYTTLEQAKTSLLITKTAIISQPKPNELRTDQLPSTLNVVVDPNSINAFLKSFVGYAWIGMFLGLLIGSYIYRLLQALVYAVIGKLFGAMSQVKLTYGEIIKIAIVAITPVIVISTVLEAFAIYFPFQNLFYFVLGMIYLFFGVRANKTI